MGGGGCLPASREFLSELRRACDRHGIVLIFDEVMTSRLGPHGLQETLGVRSDLTTLGKYVGGGMSIGAFGGRAALMARFDPRRPDHWNHAGTFNNNVLTMAAGIVGLTEVFTPEAAVQLNDKGERLRQRLNAAAERRDLPVTVTGIGSLMTIHFSRGPVNDAGRCGACQPGAEAAPPSRPAAGSCLYRTARLYRAVNADQRGRSRPGGGAVRGIPRTLGGVDRAAIEESRHWAASGSPSRCLLPAIEKSPRN